MPATWKKIICSIVDWYLLEYKEIVLTNYYSHILNTNNLLYLLASVIG